MPTSRYSGSTVLADPILRRRADRRPTFLFYFFAGSREVAASANTSWTLARLNEAAGAAAAALVAGVEMRR